MKENLTYIGHQLVDDWKVRVIEKDKDKFVYRILYPFISGWLYGKWTHNPKDISGFPEEVQKFCKETWTDAFKDGYKRWRETVGPWVE